MAKLQMQVFRCLIAVIIARPAVASLTATILRQHAQDVGVAQGGDSFAKGMGAQLAAPIDVDAPIDPPVEVDAPVEVKAPKNMGPVPDKVMKWKGKSSMPKSVQILLAGAWLSVLGLLPVVYAIIDHKAVTKTQMIVGAVMMITVFGGFWLFTNIIYFQSPHFEKSRPLTLVECIYVMAQIITTVGYGDVTPAKPRGQVFVGLYVLGALFVIAMIISDLTAHVISAARAYRERLAAEKLQSEQGEIEAVMSMRRQQTLSKVLSSARPSLEPLLSGIAVFLFFDICWILFFHYYPGEGKSWTDAIYMSVITLSTVGFGVFTPVTEAGMVFAAFWMLFGTAALVNVISQFTALMVQLNDYERITKTEESGLLADCLEGSQEISELQFLRYGLVRSKIADNATIDEILEAFKGLEPQNGKVKSQDIEKYLSQTYGKGETP
jgi:voltage-gated potassium channel Kch